MPVTDLVGYTLSWARIDRAMIAVTMHNSISHGETFSPGRFTGDCLWVLSDCSAVTGGEE